MPLLVYTELGDMSISPVFANRPSAKQFANYLNADVEAALAKSSINYVINKSQSVSGYRKRRYLGRYFAHPMMQNRRAKRDDYKPSA
ncbi:hypothetical protein, partial [Piscirickettsia salmonis]